MTDLNILPSECDCETCSRMCHVPCCGTPKDIQKLIDAGYADRLMIDDLPDEHFDATVIKPALKEYEGRRAPWHTASIKGCTFWNDGKCKLHNLDLKPLQGKLAHHDNEEKHWDAIGELITNSWKGKEAEIVIENWKKCTGFEDFYR